MSRSSVRAAASRAAGAAGGLLAAALGLTGAVALADGPSPTAPVRIAAAPASAGACAPVSIYVNTPAGGGASARVFAYSPSGSAVSSLPVPSDYGDIAFDGDGTALYGIRFTGPATLDTVTIAAGPGHGTVTSRSLTGPIDNVNGNRNALSGLPGGHLVVGVHGSSTLYVIDPDTGVSTVWDRSLPNGLTSAGDFLTLPGGDVMALATGTVGARTGDWLVRLHPDGSSDVVGAVPDSWGMAQSGGDLYLTTAIGDLVRISGIPSTPSTAALATVLVVHDDALFYGATSTQDSGSCNALELGGMQATFYAGVPPVMSLTGLAPTARGTVAFSTAGTALCTVTLPATRCTASAPLPLGSHPVEAVYSANGQTASTTVAVVPAPPSDSRRSQSVAWTGGPAAGTSVSRTTRTVQVSASSTSGLPVTFTSATPATPATCTTSPSGLVALVAPGTCSLTASQAGDATWRAAASSTSFQVSDPADLSSRLSAGATRLAGSDRVATALSASTAVFPDGRSNAVVIARSDQFADAVAGARLAALLDGPLLLTDREDLDADVADEVRRVLLPGGRVYLLGQTEALSAGVAAAAQGLSRDHALIRIGGQDRFETALGIADRVTSTTGDTGSIYVVTGRDFADGVATSALAARTGGVVVLSDGATLPGTTAAYLAEHDPTGARTVPVGGAARAAVRAAGLEGAADRAVVGSDRYDTAARLAARYRSDAPAGGTSSGAVGPANGGSWADSLAGAASMGALQGPLLLTERSQVPAATTGALGSMEPAPSRVVVFGGPRAVDGTTFEALAAYARATPADRPLTGR